MASLPSDNIICLEIGKSKQKIEMTESVVRMCKTIANMLDDIDDTETVIPITNIEMDIFQKVKDYCEYYKDKKIPSTEEEMLEFRIKPLIDWDKDFVNVPLSTLFGMIISANYLDINHMLNITCKAVAEMIKGKTPTEIKKVFGVEGDFTEEEKDQILRDNPWLRDKEEAISSGGAPAPVSAPTLSP